MKRAVVVLFVLIANAILAGSTNTAPIAGVFALGSARVSRAGDGVLAIATEPAAEGSSWRDTATSTRDACATWTISKRLCGL